MKEEKNLPGPGSNKKDDDSKKDHYNIMVDRNVIKVEQECMTGSMILALANKTPYQRFQLNIRFKGGKVSKVGYEEKICFSDPGIEKFMTIPLDQTEGGK
jgi:hypothetical protein